MGDAVGADDLVNADGFQPLQRLVDEQRMSHQYRDGIRATRDELSGGFSQCMPGARHVIDQDDFAPLRLHGSDRAIS